MTGRLLVVIPGFGEPDFMCKMDILVKNMIRIRNTYHGEMRVLIFLYSISKKKILMDRLWFLGSDIIIHDEKGRLGYFLYKYVKPSALRRAGITDVLIILDDVSLPSDININTLLHLRDRYDIDVLSPSISIDSYGGCHSFMTTEGFNSLRITNFIELFCYVMTIQAYEKYYSLFNKETIYMWGIDIAMYSMLKLRMAIYDPCSVRHFFSNSWTDPKMMKEVKKELHYTKKRLRNNNFCFEVFQEIDFEEYTVAYKKWIRQLNELLLLYRYEDDRFRGFTKEDLYKKKNRKLFVM